MRGRRDGRQVVMRYLRLWGDVYVNPARFAHRIVQAPAPRWGFVASLHRAVMNSLLLYLPLALMGRVPPEPPYLAVAPERYYAVLIALAPLVLPAQWLLGGATIHAILRLTGRRSDFDRVLNITGFVTLAIGTVLLLWDWIWLAAGGMNQYSLGISHLVIDLWGIAVITLALRRVLGVPVWLGVTLNIIAIAVALPPAIMFMRSPL